MKAGWVSYRLDSVAMKITDGSHNPPKGVADSEFLMLSSKNVFDDQLHYDAPRYLTPEQFQLEDKRTRVAHGDVLLTIVGTIGRCAVVPENAPKITLQRSVAVIRPNKELVDPRFLMYLFLSSGEELNAKARGVAQKGIYLESLRELKVLLPNLSEQLRIVAILDEAFAEIATAKANAEKNLQNARALFESYLSKVFTERGEEWVEIPLGEVGKVSMCKRIFKEQTKSTGDIPFYKIGTFGKEADAFISDEMYKQYREKYPFPNTGDVLISAAGTIGRRVVYNGEDAYFQDSNIVWISNDEKVVLNHYLYHFYGACDWNSTSGATIARLYNDNLRQILIAFPKSRHEQRRLAVKLDAIFVETDRLESIYQQKLTALDELKQSLLHEAFSGAL